MTSYIFYSDCNASRTPGCSHRLSAQSRHLHKFTLATRGLGCSNASASRNCRVSRLTTAWDPGIPATASRLKPSAALQPFLCARSKHSQECDQHHPHGEHPTPAVILVPARSILPLQLGSYLSWIYLWPATCVCVGVCVGTGTGTRDGDIILDCRVSSYMEEAFLGPGVFLLLSIYMPPWLVNG